MGFGPVMLCQTVMLCQIYKDAIMPLQQPTTGNMYAAP